jgi:thioredoxin 1
MEIKHVKASEFNNEVLKSDKPVLVDFWADWCGPVLEQVAAKVDDVQIVKINVDEESSVAEKYNIMSIPTLLLFKNGECVAKSVGFISEGQVMEFIGK